MTSTKPRRDIHAELTDCIVEAIEQGAGDFQLPWHRMAVRPTNAVTGHRYRGVNILSLWIAAEARGYETGLWATYRQWSQAGAQLRRGEKATPVVFYKAFEVDTEGAEGEPAKETRLFARAFRVFNADQVDGFEVAAPERIGRISGRSTSGARPS